MIWEVEGTDELVEWFEALDRTDQVRVEAAIEHLERFGPDLGRPWADSLRGTRIKELIPRGGHVRILFRFDPRSVAILLVGGDKAMGEVVPGNDPACRAPVPPLPGRAPGGGRPAMRTNRLTRARQRLMADPAFAADVARENVVMAELDLARARRTTGMTQEDVAAVMRTSQENISRIERQRDVRVSTLVEFVRAQGGEIEITATFDGTRISLLRPVVSA